MSFVPTSGHEALASLQGRWQGRELTWLDADATPEDTAIEATIESLFDGRWARIDYRGTVMGKPHSGQMIWGFHKDADTFQMLQIDTFHTGTMMMLSVGDGPVFSVRGSYAAGAERWGWKTTLEIGDELVIRAFNIHPSGQEDRAIEMRLTRA